MAIVHRRETSQRSSGKLHAARGKNETRLDIIAFKIREIIKYFVFGHARGQHIEHVHNANAHTPNAGLAAAFTRLHRNAPEKLLHGHNKSRIDRIVK